MTITEQLVAEIANHIVGPCDAITVSVICDEYTRKRLHPLHLELLSDWVLAYRSQDHLRSAAPRQTQC